MTKEMINKIAKSYIDYAETIGDYYPDDIGQQDYMLSEFMRENVPDENRAEFWQVVKQIREAGNKMNTQITPDENKCSRNFRSAGVFYVLVCWHGQDKGVYEFDPEG